MVFVNILDIKVELIGFDFSPYIHVAKNGMESICGLASMGAHKLGNRAPMPVCPQCEQLWYGSGLRYQRRYMSRSDIENALRELEDKE